ncbi:hypothetical protein OH460_08710 [Vibrio sp. Makdt]|uniref:hypothetical protein n=1 Tax=Vibrio sp. Makdt TaxID=2998828 RepID=UPI0022CD9343|nr:hypothetical protein [Vibrio sp. Makdt]MDA0152382.1 hypothetical protein [Vibrio sp. Makdt]
MYSKPEEINQEVEFISVQIVIPNCRAYGITAENMDEAIFYSPITITHKNGNSVNIETGPSNSVFNHDTLVVVQEIQGYSRDFDGEGDELLDDEMNELSQLKFESSLFPDTDTIKDVELKSIVHINIFNNGVEQQISVDMHCDDNDVKLELTDAELLKAAKSLVAFVEYSVFDSQDIEAESAIYFALEMMACYHGLDRLSLDSSVVISSFIKELTRSVEQCELLDGFTKEQWQEVLSLLPTPIIDSDIDGNSGEMIFESTPEVKL